MESFSLLKYWRTTTTTTTSTPPTTTTTSAPPSTTNPLLETEDDSSSASSSDEGPFFDLEFAVPDDDEEDDIDPVDDDEEDEDFNFSLPADHLPNDHPLPLSPSDDLFFKGRLLPLEPTSGHTSKHHLLHHHHNNHHLSLKSKLLVYALGLKRHHQNHKAASSSDPTTSPTTHRRHNKQHGGRFFAVKLEEVPIVSLFTRDGSSRASGSGDRSQRPSVDDDELSRRFSKETLHRYLSKIKPLYVKVSKRHSVKNTTSEHHHSRPHKEAAEHEVSEIPSRLRVVCKHLGKSRSASAVAAAPSPSPPPPAIARRRDDSLLQQQDGIQSAIAHCKRSFNGTRETPDSALPRSKSDSCDDRACTEICMEDCL